jgi:hypothetical protein
MQVRVQSDLPQKHFYSFSLYRSCVKIYYVVVAILDFVLKNYPKKATARCDFKWCSGSQNNNLKIVQNISPRVIPL